MAMWKGKGWKAYGANGLPEIDSDDQLRAEAAPGHINFAHGAALAVLAARGNFLDGSLAGACVWRCAGR